MGRGLLMGLPNMTEQIADSILDWIDEDDQPREFGAENEYYQQLANPYDAANKNLESIEELLLVQGVTPELLYGLDQNRNGVLDPTEASSAIANGQANVSTTGATSGSTSISQLGWAPYLTLYSKEKNVDLAGNPRININGQDLTTLQTDLQAVITNEDWVSFILAYRIYGSGQANGQGGGTGGQGGGGGQEVKVVLVVAVRAAEAQAVVLVAGGLAVEAQVVEAQVAVAQGAAVLAVVVLEWRTGWTARRKICFQLLNQLDNNSVPIGRLVWLQREGGGPNGGGGGQGGNGGGRGGDGRVVVVTEVAAVVTEVVAVVVVRQGGGPGCGGQGGGGGKVAVAANLAVGKLRRRRGLGLQMPLAWTCRWRI